MNGSQEIGVAEKTPTFIDLFCGCGGFSLGMIRAGFRCLAAVDNSPEAVAVFASNVPAPATAGWI